MAFSFEPPADGRIPGATPPACQPRAAPADADQGRVSRRIHRVVGLARRWRLGGDLVLRRASVLDLRTPGREDEEDLETGSRAAAAGGFCGILAMANTEPPVDTAADVAALREQAREQAAIPIGFCACVTRGMAGRS